MMEELFPFQQEGAEWLASQKVALLADEMGLGKSAQAINACDRINAQKILVLCPAVARFNWLREFEKFSPLKRQAHVVLTRSQAEAPRYQTQPDSAGIRVCSYDLAHALSPAQYDVLILDEVHFLKNPKAKRTQAVLGKAGLAHASKRIWALSGTPAPNHAAELWPILKTFGKTNKDYDSWVEHFCNYYTVNAYSAKRITGTKTKAIPELRAILSTVMLRRRKEEVMKELPPIVYEDLTVEPGEVDLQTESSFIQYVFPNDRTKELSEQLRFEKTLIEQLVERDGTGIQAMKALEALSQSVSTLRRYTGVQKVQAVAELVKEELESNAYEKVVLFAVHRDVIEGLRSRLSKFKAVTLYGGTDPEKRQHNIDKFQKDKKTRVFIGNIQACGTAITLTRAHHVIFVEQSWTPSDNAQAAMRCHRIGQEKPVFVRFVGLADSIDERVSQVLKRKARELTQIFDDETHAEKIFSESELKNSQHVASDGTQDKNETAQTVKS